MQSQSEDPYRCEVCEAEFGSREELQQHVHEMGLVG